MSVRAVETVIMSIVSSALASGISLWVATKVLETRVQYIEQNVSQLTDDIRDIRNHLLSRDLRK